MRCTVHKTAQWEAEVERDPALFAEAVQWAVGGLVAQCEATAVAPVGTLTVVDEDSPALRSADVVPVARYRLDLELDAPPVLVAEDGGDAFCPLYDWRQRRVFGPTGPLTVAEVARVIVANAAMVAHWQREHSAGDR